MDFPYGEAEIAHLRTRDPKLGAAIDRIGPIHREVDPDLFSSVLHHIIGQQVSMAAQRTVWQRLQTAAAPLSPETVAAMSVESLQALGMTYRRVSYILEFARKVASDAFDLKALAEIEDSQVLAQLTSLRGVGPWTAEMLLIFGLYMIDGSSHIIGELLNYVFGVFDFGGKYPVVTLMLVGGIMAILTTVLRAFTTDMLSQAKNQAIMSSFNKELKEARLEQNLYKIKKLTAVQTELMNKNMETTSSMMKVMPYTMLIVVPMFLWVRYFVAITLVDAGTAMVAFPWTDGVDLNSSLWFMPVWIVTYSLISIPLAQIVNRLIRGYKFKKHLLEIDKVQSIHEEI